MPQTNPKVTNIAINNNAGAFTVIKGTMQASKVLVMEDPSLNAGVAQGLQGYYLDPNSNPANPTRDLGGNNAAVQQTWLPNSAGQTGPAYEPIIFGGPDGRVHGAYGEYTSAQGTPLLQLRTNSATAGGVLLVEWA
jgi:hypothetical protein